jgi:hydroxyethylthiazole kinase
VENNRRADSIWADVQRIRAEAPLVHNITNYVVMNITANALLALGASPVMAHAEEEVEEMAAIARALVINIGTLSPPWIAAMFKAGGVARRNARPIILDPVGAGATTFRTETARSLLEELAPAIVRGNASEIRALAYDERGTRGVDSAHANRKMRPSAAEALPAATAAWWSTSGAVDLISVGRRHGSRLQRAPDDARVTGMGCTASALAGAFAAVNPIGARCRRECHGGDGDCRRTGRRSVRPDRHLRPSIPGCALPADRIGHSRAAQGYGSHEAPRDWRLYLVTDRGLARWTADRSRGGGGSARRSYGRPVA